MVRGSSGFERPPVWAIVVMVLGVAWLAVGGLLLSHRDAGAASSAGNPLVSGSTGVSAAAGTPPNILVIGDSYTGGSNMGGDGEHGWARLMGARLASDGYACRVTIRAAGGSGYVARGPSGSVFDDLVQQGAKNFQLIVFLGSRNDSDPPGLAAAVQKAYADAKAQSPQAQLLVISTPWINDGPAPADYRANRDVVKAAATAIGAAYIDPIAENWFGGQYTADIGSDRVHPTDVGHQHMADLITPRVEQLLAAAGEKVAPSRP